MTRDEIDARRYRWLRENGQGCDDILWNYQGAELDAHVDERMAEDTRYELTDAGREALGGGK